MSLIAGPSAGPFTLLHLPTGAMHVFARAIDVAHALRALGVGRLVGDPAVAALVRSTKNPALDFCEWRLTNLFGERLSSTDLPALPTPARKRRPFGKRWTLRWCREPRVMRARREAASFDDLDAPVRSARRLPVLLSACDDHRRRPQRCWKQQRRTQWKPKK